VTPQQYLKNSIAIVQKDNERSVCPYVYFSKVG